MALRLTGLPYAARRSPFDGREYEAVMQAMLEAAGAPEAVVELALMDDPAIRALHRTALGCDGPTNILSFPVPEKGGDVLGSLALSVDTLRREAFLYGQGLEDHAVRLLAHGVAHLLGHEHGPAMDALTGMLERAGREGLAVKNSSLGGKPVSNSI